LVNPNEIVGPVKRVLASGRGRGSRELTSARQVGLKAKDLLGVPEFSAKVLAVLPDAVYLSTREGETLWICPERSPRHRRCILASRRPMVVPGEEIFYEFPVLRFNRGPLIDLSTAREWNPSELAAGERARPAEVWAIFRQLLGVLCLMEVPEGMGEGVCMAHALVEKRNLPSFLPGTLIGRAGDAMLDLARACLEQDLGAVIRRGKELVGLGPGLTPSGDDFLGGLLFAGQSLQKAYPENFGWTEETASELLDWADTRTHPISHAILCDLASGHGPEPMHDLAAGLLRGRDFNPVMKAVSRLRAIGHSSGWDMLAGAMTGMLMVKRSLP
jgi:hypothetical protein